MGKQRLTKELKIKFSNAFMETADGFKALKEIGESENFELLHKILTDKFVNNYIEKYSELLEVARGKTKEAHIAKVEKLFNQASGNEESTIFKFTKDGKVVEKTGNFINYAGAAKLSDELYKLKNWEKDGDGNNIVVDLELGKIADENIKSAEIETPEERDEKTLNHFKAEGLL